MVRKPQPRSERQPEGRNAHGGPAAAARRKAAIDRGLTADKIPGFDPGTAPLDTDAEAAGVPPVAAAEPPVPEGARADPAGLAADPSGTDRRRYRAQDRMIWWVIAAVLIAIAIIVAVIFVV
jgi:hypothetical protein